MSSGGRTTRHHKKRRGGEPTGVDLGQRGGGDLMGIYSTFKNGLVNTIDTSANYFRTWLPEPLKKLTTDSGVRSVFGGSIEPESTTTMGGGRRTRR